MQSQGAFSWPCASPGSKCSRPCVERSAWLLISPAGLYLKRLTPAVEWTPDPALAMSWLDPAKASSLLTLALPSAGVLVKMRFRAAAGSFPFRWELIDE